MYSIKAVCNRVLLSRVRNIPRIPHSPFYLCTSSKFKLTAEEFILCFRSLWNAERTLPSIVMLRWWNKSFVFLMMVDLILMIRREMEVFEYDVEEKFQFFIKIHEIQYEINFASIISSWDSHLTPHFRTNQTNILPEKPRKRERDRKKAMLKKNIAGKQNKNE